MATTDGATADSVSASAVNSHSVATSSVSSSASTGGSSTGSGGVSSRSSGSASPKWKGRILKRFKLLDILGQGSMGRVFRAEDITLRRHVAIKVLPTKNKSGQRDQRIEQFIREARSAASLEHANAVSIYEIGESSGVHYIAMELVEGGNLEKLVQASGPLDVQRACQVCAEAAEALGYAHQIGIIHRDVKPSNLLLSRNGRCKLADFGLARLDEPDDPHGTRGECVGTPAYLAPELPIGQKATPQADIYSLGCTLWFLLVGRPPYSAVSKRDMIKMHVHAAFPNLREIRPDVPEKLVEAIERACAKDPGSRFASADQFAKILRSFTIATAGTAIPVPGFPAGTGSPATLPPALSASHGASFGSMPTVWNASDPQMQQMSGGAGVAGSSAHASAMNLSGGVSGSMQNIPGIAPVAVEPAAERRAAPIIWAGIGTVAAATLICVGVWIARGNATGAQPAVASPAIVKPAAPVVDGPNVVINGTIDPGPKGDGVLGWFIPDKHQSAVQFLTEDGNRFIRLTNDDPAKTVLVDQKISVDPSWKAVTVSVRMRAMNFKPGAKPAQDARLAFAFKDAAGTRVGNWPPVPYITGDSDWTERTVTAEVPPGANHMVVQMAIFYATGSVDFDDIRVTPKITGK